MARPSPFFSYTHPLMPVFPGSSSDRKVRRGEMPNDSNVAVHVSKARSGPR